MHLPRGHPTHSLFLQQVDAISMEDPLQVASNPSSSYLDWQHFEPRSNAYWCEMGQKSNEMERDGTQQSVKRYSFYILAPKWRRQGGLGQDTKASPTQQFESGRMLPPSQIETVVFSLPPLQQ